MKSLLRLTLLVLIISLLLVAPGSPLSFEPAEADMDHHLYLPLLAVPPPKKGIFVTYGACGDVASLKARWYFTNEVQPPAGCPQPDPNFVPVLHNAGSMSKLSTAIGNAQGSGWLKGFIEPDLSWQGNVSPDAAAELWRQIETEATFAGIKLVSPSPSQQDPGWLWRMVDEYRSRYGGNSPRFDAIAWNYYSPDAAQMQAFFTERRNEALARGYDVPIWVAEYGGECWNNGNGNSAIMTTVTPWLNETSWIGRYAWFANRILGTEPWGPGWQSCSLVNPSSGALKSLGQLYAGY